MQRHLLSFPEAPNQNLNNASATNGNTNDSATNNGETAATNNTTSTNDANLTGAQLYVKYCEVCHGPEGTGAAVWAGNIQGIDPIHGIVRDGRGQMAPVPATDEEIGAIQEYLNSFGVDLSTLSGIEIYANQCASCHGPEGQGTADGPIIQFAVPGFAKWVTRNGREGKGFPGPMSAYGPDRVTDTQLDEIIDYLHAQERPTDGQALYTTFCSNCHGDNGRSGTVGKNVLGENPSEKIRQGEGGTNYGARFNYMPSWSSSAMSNEEISLITAYMNTL